MLNAPRLTLIVVLLALAACSRTSQAPGSAEAPAAVEATPAVASADEPAPVAHTVNPTDATQPQDCLDEPPPPGSEDTRPLCGGVAALPPQAPQHAYRMEYLQCPGGVREAPVVCDITRPFTVTGCGGQATIEHTPTSEHGGTFSSLFRNPEGRATQQGTYTLEGNEDSLKAVFTGGPMCATARITRCFKVPSNTIRLVKVDRCDA
ncbi:hypothetical protein [Thermomonas sp.]|uniref:hypothetical protein n=1 Tax=Thermomonas sp. TaxID=1971895 RepID=UPI00262CCBCF|nr:hypothetical protein [Thermomonas sp.]